VTDLPFDLTSIPLRLGVVMDLGADGTLTGSVSPPAAMCDRGSVPLAPLVFLVDAVAGVAVDTDPDAWTFTSDLSLRIPLGPPPARIDCDPIVLREGRRSITSEAALTVDGRPWGHCFISFARVPRRDDDPPKPAFDRSDSRDRRRVMAEPLDRTLRDAAGFASVDASGGVVSATLRPDLLNPAGAMQGAMVSGLAEVAALDLADHLGLSGAARHVATDIEVRFLAQNRVSPIVTRARLAGGRGDGLVRVDLVDDGGAGRITTSALVRVAPAPA
jgi:acyl-coenzyme A thioesterase PaaI-like protein